MIPDAVYLKKHRHMSTNKKVLDRGLKFSAMNKQRIKQSGGGLKPAAATRNRLKPVEERAPLSGSAFQRTLCPSRGIHPAGAWLIRD